MASITDQTRWRRALNHVAADLKAVIDIAAGQSVKVTQDTATDLEALVTLKGLRGIIPNPITATRLNESKSALGAAAAIVYTVDGGQKLFIDCASLSSRESADAVGVVDFYVRDDGDETVYYIDRHFYDKAGHQTSSKIFLKALEVLAGWDILIVNDHANLDATAFIHGWLEDV